MGRFTSIRQSVFKYGVGKTVSAGIDKLSFAYESNKHGSREQYLQSQLELSPNDTIRGCTQFFEHYRNVFVSFTIPLVVTKPGHMASLHEEGKDTGGFFVVSENHFCFTFGRDEKKGRAPVRTKADMYRVPSPQC